MKFKLLLLVFSVAFSMSCSAQFFGPNPLPYPGGKFNATETTLTKDFFKPCINVSATFSNGTSAAGGVGVQWQHDKADAASNSYVIQYSFSAIAWLTVNANKVGGTVGLVASVPGTAGMINLGGGRDLTAGQWVVVTGVNIPVP